MNTIEEQFQWTRVVASTIKAGAMSLIAMLPFAFVAFRGVRPEALPWGPDADAEVVKEAGTQINAIVEHLQNLLLIIPGIAAACGGLWNVFKNRKRAGAPSVKKMFSLVAIGLIVSGCAGLGGTTKYDMTFTDSQGLVDPETGENTGGMGDTSFHVSARGRAGDVIQQIAKMGYEWDSTSGKITVASDASMDSTARAEALKEYFAMQQANFSQFVTTLQMGMTLAAPQKQTETANQFALRQQFGNLVNEKFDQILPLVQEQQTQMQTLRQQIIEQGGLIDRLVNGLGGLPAPVVTPPRPSP